MSEDPSRAVWLSQARGYLRQADPVLARRREEVVLPGDLALATSYPFSTAFEPEQAPRLGSA